MTAEGWPLSWSIAGFVVSVIVITAAGVKLTRTADRLADHMGWGEALFGGVILGASTSLSGLVTSISAAAEDHPDLAFSNAIGGIAVQTVFLAVADVFHRGVNLEHAAASLSNTIYGAMLVVLLAFPMLAALGPEVAVLGVHPISALLPLVYIYGLHLVREARSQPMWRPQPTRETKVDVPEEDDTGATTTQLWIGYVAFAAPVILCGWIVARAGASLAVHTGVSQTLVGAMLTGVTTSIPELVTSVAAVRQGALTLAVGGIIGGNTFDVLFLLVSDAAYRGGSIYHAIEPNQLFLVALCQLMMAVLLIGLLRREKRGIAKIGLESTLLVILYIGGVAVLFTSAGGAPS